MLGRGLDLAGAGFQGQGRSWFFGFCFRERYWAGAYRSEVHSMNAGFSSGVWFCLEGNFLCCAGQVGGTAAPRPSAVPVLPDADGAAGTGSFLETLD